MVQHCQTHRVVHPSQVENMTVELRALRSAVGGVGRDASRSSDEQLAQLADVNKALVNVIAEKDRLIQYQQREVWCCHASNTRACMAICSAATKDSAAHWLSVRCPKTPKPRNYEEYVFEDFLRI